MFQVLTAMQEFGSHDVSGDARADEGERGSG